MALLSRREALKRLSAAGIVLSAAPLLPMTAQAAEPAQDGMVVKFPGPWAFLHPKPALILVSDQQLEDLQDPDKEVDVSLTGAPNLTTLRRFCERAKTQGAHRIILAFDEFWSQYRKGQGGKPRQLLPDTDEYVNRLVRISQTLKQYGLGLELSLLSPLEVGRGYESATGESGQWVQYREGYRDPKTGLYNLALWEQRQWTNNKGTVQLRRLGVRVFAFNESRISATNFYSVDPASIVELQTPELQVDESSQPSTSARRLIIQGKGDHHVKCDRVLAVVRYATPEMDYFSPKALPFLQKLVDKYHDAGVPLQGLYADEMHIQQDWGYFDHHDEGQFTFRYLTPHMAEKFAQLFGSEYRDFEKYLVYFCYAQHGFLPGLEALAAAQHVLGRTAEDVQRTFLLRRRYYDLVEQTVVTLFTDAKKHAETKYGRDLESRAHATWAQSPTIDRWAGGDQHAPMRQYEYTPDFVWSNTVQQAASACSDYFEWNAFLTGGGNDHAEGGWLDRNYYGIALACSTGILNAVPYAYAGHWGMPHPVLIRRQAVCDAFGAAPNLRFQALQDAQHRDVEVLMLYPSNLVACEERFGSWMTQYGYANYVTARQLLQRATVVPGGKLEMAGRTFTTLVALFESLPSPELLDLMQTFVWAGGKVIWSGPPPRVNTLGEPAFEKWRRIFRIRSPQFGMEGLIACGKRITFSGVLKGVPPQVVLTDFLVDRIYPVERQDDTEPVAHVASSLVGTHYTLQNGGSATYLGFRPRDDQSASLGEEVRTWFEILRAVDAYPGDDNPSVVSRTSPHVACRFPNGTLAVAPHYARVVEAWPGGFHRDQKQDQEIMTRNPLSPAILDLKSLHLAGHTIDYSGELCMAFRLDPEARLIAFAGENCRTIRIDGRDHAFATEQIPFIGWAPIQTERRIKGGAIMDVWVRGKGEIRIPLPTPTAKGTLHTRGPRLGTIGQPVNARCEGGLLIFDARPDWPHNHLMLIET